jgi:DNA-binding NarL/FixJ family response regulator
MRFLLIDDHPLMRTALKQLLSAKFPSSIIEEANNASSAIQQISNRRWSVVVVDIDLPDRSGLDLLADIRKLAPSSPILVFSGQNEQEFGYRVLKAGAAGFVGKLSSNQEIETAFDRVLSGKKYITSDLASTLIDTTFNRAGRLPHELLSEREFEVLRMFGRGYSSSEIAENLAISIKTASTYRARILSKLGLKSTGEIVRYALKNGLA